MSGTFTLGAGQDEFTISESSDDITMNATAGSMSIAPSLVDGQTLKLGKNAATEMVFAPHGTAGSEKITLTNTAGTAADAIGITATAGGIDVNATTSYDLDAAGAVSIDSTAGSITMGTALADGQT